VQPDCVVVRAPLLDDDLCFLQAVERIFAHRRQFPGKSAIVKKFKRFLNGALCVNGSRAPNDDPTLSDRIAA
jgi:hypothetical protein